VGFAPGLCGRAGGWGFGQVGGEIGVGRGGDDVCGCGLGGGHV